VHIIHTFAPITSGRQGTVEDVEQAEAKALIGAGRARAATEQEILDAERTDEQHGDAGDTIAVSTGVEDVESAPSTAGGEQQVPAGAPPAATGDAAATTRSTGRRGGAGTKTTSSSTPAAPSTPPSAETGEGTSTSTSTSTPAPSSSTAPAPPSP
jgi:hypothetical protein